MPRPNALDNAKRLEALRRLAAGEGVRTIAADLGVSHMTIHRLSRHEQVEGATRHANEGQRRGGEIESIDARRWGVLERLEAAMDEATGADLASLARAHLATTEALAKGALLRRSTGDDAEELQAVAERVRARLTRLAESPRPVEVVEAAEPAHDVTGTDGG